MKIGYGSLAMSLCSGVLFFDFGHERDCVDKDPAQELKYAGTGHRSRSMSRLDDLMAKNVVPGRWSFHGDLKKAVDGGGMRVLSPWHTDAARGRSWAIDLMSWGR